ncbi:MAG TPA: hypothetical protein VF168_10095 [Trueperaceae bacterium]
MSQLRVQGHERVLEALRDIRSSSLLFVGPEGVGRRTSARWYAAFLNCQAAAKARPCLGCDSCRRFETGHPDYREVSARDTTSTGRQSRRPEIKIGQLVPRPGDDEPLSSWLEQRPSFRRRVGVIDGAERLTAAAANAFLKMLEEPPSYSSIILIAPSPQAVLPTIGSRCTVLRFAPVETEGLGPPGHPAHRLGRPGPLLLPREGSESLLAQVGSYFDALHGDLEGALAAADLLAERWQEGGWGQEIVESLREKFRLLPAPLRPQADDLLLECEEAIAGYSPATLAVRVMTLELRALTN